MNAVSLIKRIRQKRMLIRSGRFAVLPDTSIYEESFWMDLRHPKDGKKYLQIGEKSIIGGCFVFETETGFVSVGNRTLIAGSSTLISKSKILIGDDVIIAGGTVVYDHDSHSVHWELRRNDISQQYKDFMELRDPISRKNWDAVPSAPIQIKNGVWIGRDALILKGVTIGEYAVVGAGAVVTKDVEPWTVVAGNPAKIVKRLKKDGENLYDEGFHK